MPIGQAAKLSGMTASMLPLASSIEAGGTVPAVESQLLRALSSQLSFHKTVDMKLCALLLFNQTKLKENDKEVRNQLNTDKTDCFHQIML